MSEETTKPKHKRPHRERVHDALKAMSKRVRGAEFKRRRTLFTREAREARRARREEKRKHGRPGKPPVSEAQTGG